MTAEPEALRMARKQLAAHAHPTVICTAGDITKCECGHCIIARALISAEAVVQAAQKLADWEKANGTHFATTPAEEFGVMLMWGDVRNALDTHDAALSPASTRPADVSMDGGNADRSSSGDGGGA